MNMTAGDLRGFISSAIDRALAPAKAAHAQRTKAAVSHAEPDDDSLGLYRRLPSPAGPVKSYRDLFFEGGGAHAMKIFTKDESTDDLTRREAELKKERQALEGRVEELNQIDAAGDAANTEVTVAEAEVRRVHDPVTDVSQADRDAAMARMRKARLAKQKAAAARAAFPHTRESLAERAQALARASELLEQEKFCARSEDVTRRRIPVLLAAEALELEAREIEGEAYRRWPEDAGELKRGAGIPLASFPDGILHAVAPMAGHVARSIFEDDFLRFALMAYPRLAALLPPDRAAAIQAKIEADYQRGVVLQAGAATGWHHVETHGLAGLPLASGVVRQRLRGLA